MTPTTRTPQQRDRRFARIRRITQGLLLGSGVASGLLVTYIASGAKPYTTVPVTLAPGASTSTTSPSAPTTTSPATKTPTSVYTPPTTAPVTSTTVCYSTPSGIVTCY